MRLWPRIERDRALRIQDCQISYGTSIPKMRLICRDPIKKRMSGFAPAGVFRRAAKPMKPRHHTAGRGLSQPEHQLRGGFGDVPPVWLRVCIGSGNISNRATLHHRICDSALLSTDPNRGVAGAALVIGVKPCSNLAYALQVLYRIQSASEIADVH